MKTITTSSSNFVIHDSYIKYNNQIHYSRSRYGFRLNDLKEILKNDNMSESKIIEIDNLSESDINYNSENHVLTLNLGN